MIIRFILNILLFKSNKKVEFPLVLLAFTFTLIYVKISSYFLINIHFLANKKLHYG